MSEPFQTSSNVLFVQLIIITITLSCLLFIPSCETYETESYRSYTGKSVTNPCHDTEGEMVLKGIRFVYYPQSRLRPILALRGMLYVPEKETEAIGAEGVCGLLYEIGNGLWIYLEGSHGIVKGGDWREVETDYSFPSQLGGGVGVSLSADLYLELGISWIHFSWGKSKMPEWLVDNLHLPDGTPNPGFESIGLNISVGFK